MRYFQALGLLAMLAESVAAANYTIAVNGTASHPIPKTLYGVMWEDINHSGDGGLYAELIRNRAFQAKDVTNQASALEAYKAIGGATLKVVNDVAPVSASLPNSLALTVPEGTTGNVGFGNEGYWGIHVDASWTYKVSIYAKVAEGSTFTGPITVGLQSATTGDVYATSTIEGLTTEWAEHTATLTPSANGADTYNNFTVTVDGAAASGQTIYATMVSLFPPTFKDRPNGLRIDVAQAMLDMKPGFFRFGGNNGETVASRWQWNKTLGSLLDRPGRQGNWDYINTDGLGLLEIVQMTEDLNMELIASVWAGVTLSPTAVVANASLDPYIDEAVGLLNFLTGDASKSPEAALRASLGHPEPVHIKYCEIGNEDFTSPNTYQSYRWPRFYNRLSTLFPDITFVATTNVNSPVLSPKPPAWDVHVYQIPSWFPANSNYYDNFARDGTQYLELEYAVTITNPNCLYGDVSCGRLPWSTLTAAVSEAAFATGFERNADIVVAAAYAPVMQNIQSRDAWQWIPDLFGYDASTILLSASYHVQKLLSLNKGTEYLPSTRTVATGPTQWSVTRDADAKTVLIKIANADTADATIAISLPFPVAATGTSTVLTSIAGGSGTNTPDHPKQVAPVTNSFNAGQEFTYVAPSVSFTVLSIALA